MYDYVSILLCGSEDSLSPLTPQVFQTPHFTRQVQGQQEDRVLRIEQRITATPPTGPVL